MLGKHRIVSVFVACAAALAVISPGSAGAMHASVPVEPLSARPAQAGMSFSLGASVGQVAGTASELVFDYPFGSRTKISELTWDLKDVTLAGVQASVGLGKRVRVNLGWWSALDEGSGGMVDKDWLYTDESFFFLEPDDDNWTHESRHPDTSVDEVTLIDVNLSFLALQTGSFSLRGIVGYSSDTWAWSARGGTYVYSEENLRDSFGTFDKGEQVITYEQQYSIPYLGVGATWATPVFAVDGHLIASSAVTATDTDYHVLRDTLFEGEFSGGTFVGFGVKATWAFAPQWSATLGVDYQSISEIVGDVTIIDPDYGVWDDASGGGVALNATVVTLGAGYRF